MQRQALVPLHYYMKGKNEGDTRMMDVACGTGRFLTFLKDNYPRAKVYGVSHPLAISCPKNLRYLFADLR
jgi:ubiquinone/menaquinone biosynthesis C-methylase UbiE